MYRYSFDARNNGSVIDTAKITVATAGTELPIVTINYSTGTLTTVSGSQSVVGIGTAWVANVSAGDKLETAGGTIYIVQSVESNTTLTLYEPASSSEAGVTYKTYTAFETIKVIIKADDGNTHNIYVGQKGVTSSTGLELDAGNSVELLLNNKNTNLYIDASANAQVAWILFERTGAMQTEVAADVTAGQSKRTGVAGTKQIIGTKVQSIAIMISALSTNAASVYVGDSTVTATTGFELVPGEIMPFPLYLNDANADLYIWAATDEGVSYLVTTY